MPPCRLLIAFAAAVLAALTPGLGPRHPHSAALLPTSLRTALVAPPVSGTRGVAGAGPLRVDGRAFRTPDGRRFAWRGLTAFRLLEMVATGRERDADAVLRWSASHGVTVVRVLSMADVLFHLSPADGRRALPRLLALAQGRGLQVEVVALADTDRIPVDAGEQVQALGAACQEAGVCLLEVANEPWARHTQRRHLGEPAVLASLKARVASGIPVSLGSSADDTSDEYAAGDYLTVHVARAEGDNGWRSVARMRVAADSSARTGKPVVDDEPIGAAETSQPGRRDADPDRWFARGLLARVLAIGTTFHFEGGLQGKIPAGRELECFEAWRRGLDALPADLEERSTFRDAGAPGSAVASFDRQRALAVYVAQGEREAWAAAIAPGGGAALAPAPGWRVVSTEKHPGVELTRLELSTPRE